jgi:sorbitol-specific phosphotransferase system component IIC
MYWFGVVFGVIGAGLILGALTYVSILIGVLVHFMIILMSGPLIDKFLERRKRRSA